jgi:hypothetical protein
VCVRQDVALIELGVVILPRYGLGQDPARVLYFFSPLDLSVEPKVEHSPTG